MDEVEYVARVVKSLQKGEVSGAYMSAVAAGGWGGRGVENGVLRSR